MLKMSFLGFKQSGVVIYMEHRHWTCFIWSTDGTDVSVTAFLDCVVSFKTKCVSASQRRTDSVRGSHDHNLAHQLDPWWLWRASFKSQRAHHQIQVENSVFMINISDSISEVPMKYLDFELKSAKLSFYLRV